MSPESGESFHSDSMTKTFPELRLLFGTCISLKTTNDNDETFEYVLFTSSTGEIIPKKPESEIPWEILPSFKTRISRASKKHKNRFEVGERRRTQIPASHVLPPRQQSGSSPLKGCILQSLNKIVTLLISIFKKS